MLFFRHFVVISASAFIALSYSAIAYGAPKPNPFNKLKDNSQIEFSNLSSDAILEENYFEVFFNDEPWGIEIAQITEQQREQNQTQRQLQPRTNPTRREINVPPDLRPSPNPLLFPTKPEEVTIKTTQEITLLEAIELALRNNKELQRERQNLEVTRANLRDDRGNLFPILDGQIEYEFSDSGFPGTSPRNPQRGGPIQHRLTGGLGLQYQIYQGGRVRALIRQGEKEVRQQQLQVEVQAQETRFQATENYYRLQSADAQVEIDRASVTNAEQSLRDAKLLEQAGLGSRFDVLTAEVELAREQQQLTNSIATQQTRRRELARTLGLGQQVDLKTAGAIEEAGDWNLSLEESIVLAYKNRAELEQRLLDREIQKEQETISLSQIRPQIGFNFNYNVIDVLDDNTADTFNTYTIGATLNWRIFDGGRALAQADAAKIRSQIAETNFADNRHTIRLAVESAYYQLIANKQNIASTTINVRRAEENLRLARLRFQAGVGNQSEVIDAQRVLALASGDRLIAITNYNLSLNQLQRQISNLPDSQLFEVR